MSWSLSVTVTPVTLFPVTLSPQLSPGSAIVCNHRRTLTQALTVDRRPAADGTDVLTSYLSPCHLSPCISQQHRRRNSRWNISGTGPGVEI